MSVDPPHSLAIPSTSKPDSSTEDRRPYQIDDRLAIHEVNIQKEIKRHWREILVRDFRAAHTASAT